MICPVFEVDEIVVECVVREWPLLHAVPYSIHGISHWMRVAQNGVECARHVFLERDTFAKAERIIRLFALFHDSRRLHEGECELHGPAAARSINGWVHAFSRSGLLDISIDDMVILSFACHHHTDLQPDMTAAQQYDFMGRVVGCCLDGDRLDIGRIHGRKPEKKFMFTEYGRSLCDE